MNIELKKHKQHLTTKEDLIEKIKEALGRANSQSNCVVLTTWEDRDKVYNWLTTTAHFMYGDIKCNTARKEVTVGSMQLKVIAVAQKDEQWDMLKGLHSDFIIMYGFEGFWELMVRRLLSRNRNPNARDLECKLYYIN